MGLLWVFLALFLSTLGCALGAPMTFRETGTGGNCDGCAWFAADGEITTDTPTAFSRFMADKQYHPTIYLNSPGGNLAAGLKLGGLIRNAGLSTGVAQSVPEPEDPRFDRLVPGKCVSACAYAIAVHSTVGGTVAAAGSFLSRLRLARMSRILLRQNLIFPSQIVLLTAARCVSARRGGGRHWG